MKPIEICSFFVFISFGEGKKGKIEELRGKLKKREKEKKTKRDRD